MKEEKYIKAYLKKQFKENCVLSIINIEKKITLESGVDHQCSNLVKYTVEILHDSGKRSVKYLIEKLCINNKYKRLFFNEIQVYSKVFTLMEALMTEFKDNRDKLWCELIAYSPCETILLEDLQGLNFKLMNRHEGLDFDHSLLVMRTLGRYHAMSRILIKRCLLNNTSVGPYAYTKYPGMDMLLISPLILLEEAVTKSWGEEWKYLPEKIRNLRGRVQRSLSNLVEVDESRFNVMNHGDCWTNNMMFKHVEGTDIPCAVKYIDHQISHYNSYAWDITFFLYIATRPEIRRRRYLELISAYQQSLATNLEYFHYTEGDIPTIGEVSDEMNRLKFFAMVLSLTLYGFVTSTVEEGLNLNKLYENLDNPAVGIKIDVFTDPSFISRIEKDIKNFIEEGIL